MIKKRKILVTGGKGFVGSHLCNRLIRKGIDIVNIQDNKNQVGMSLDVTQLSQLLAIDDDVGTIIHLAAKTSISKSLLAPHETYYTNLMGTLNLLEFARQKKVLKFIFLSTYVYGEPHYLPIDEKHPIHAHSPYTASKILSEELCQVYSHDFNIDIVTLRPFYIYGPNMRANSFIDCVLKQILNKYGEVKLSREIIKRDFLFIEDFLNLLEAILQKFPQGYNVYNVGYGKSYTLTEVSQILARILNKKIFIQYSNDIRPGDVTDMVADVSKICSEFDWRPSTSLEQGLKLTV
jgi:UDP-glucose 4-epimerase